MPGIAQICGCDALRARDKRRRRGGDRNHAEMSVAALLAAGAFACPGFASAQGSTQLVTVESFGGTTAALGMWQRSGRCWRRVAGPWTARLGRSGLSSNKREGDGSTPTGTYRLGSTIYGIAPNPGVRFRYHRLVCGDWWDEDPSSQTYNTFRHVACGAAALVRGLERGPLAHHAAVPLLRSDRLQRESRRPRPRLGDLPPCGGRLHRRVRQPL